MDAKKLFMIAAVALVAVAIAARVPTLNRIVYPA